MEKFEEEINKIIETDGIQHNDEVLVKLISNYFMFIESLKSDHDIMGDEKLLTNLKLLRKTLQYITEDCFDVVRQICAKHPKYNIDDFILNYE